MPVVVACAGWVTMTPCGVVVAGCCPALFGGARAGPGPRLQTGPGRPGRDNDPAGSHCHPPRAGDNDRHREGHFISEGPFIMY